jgi:integrase/recombinase XerD
VAGGDGVTALAQHVDDYLAIRHALGFKLRSERRMLADFAAFMDSIGQPTVTIDAALRWVTRPTRVGHAYLAQRMRAVRGFARYLHGIDPATEIPPLELLPARRHRPTPVIYTEHEIGALMAAARTLRPPLRAATIETLIGLLACTGLRVSEAFALDRADIDAANRLLRIRDSKYGKSREVLIHKSTLAALHALSGSPRRAAPDRRPGLRVRLKLGRPRRPQLHAPRLRPDPPRRRRQRLNARSVAAGTRPAPHVRRQHPARLVSGRRRRGRQAAADVHLPRARRPAATYWYLSAVPELLGLVAARLERQPEGPDARDLTFLLCAGERARRGRAARTRRAVR